MELEIFDLTYEGSGVGKTNGKIVFVEKTLPNEVIEAQLIKEYSGYCTARVTKVLKKSPLRQLAPCPYYDFCGGCNFQHCNYQTEQNFKLEIFNRELQKVLKAKDLQQNFKITLTPSQTRFNYRNKLKLEIQNKKLGFFQSKTHSFIQIKSCMLAKDNINKAISQVEDFLQSLSFLPKSVYIKEYSTAPSQALAICFLFPSTAKKDCKKIQQEVKPLQSAGFALFIAFGEVLESSKTLILPIDNCPVEVWGFNQINEDIANKLYNYVCEKASGKVVNAYSGRGLLTQLISKKAEFVYAIESYLPAHKSAQSLLSSSKNVKNLCGKVEDVLPLIEDKINIVVLDPPREGCKKAVLQTLLKTRPDKILYVSCNFASLLRDCAQLLDLYLIREIRIFDMFPCTANMEVALFLERK